MPSNKTWGAVFGAAGMVASLPVALVAGTVSVLFGKTFKEVEVPVIAGIESFARELGEKHGQLIEKTLVKVVVWTVVGGIGDGIADEFMDHHPPKGPDA